MRKGFPVSERLPKTFSDAILVARKLGVPYLWIDSLCIVQDDESDWAVESSQMASVYANSYLTIAAASSDSDEKGFLHLFPFEYATTVRLTSPTGEYSVAYIGRKQWFHGFTLFREHDEPLFSRGWVLQEQYLSRRTLIFSKKQMHFICKQESSDDVRAFLESKPLLYLHWDSAFRPDIARRMWRSVPSEFSRRQLTYDTDKLPAIAGIASTVSTALIGGRRQYCAGLWRDELLNDLLFSRIGEAVSPESTLYRLGPGLL